MALSVPERDFSDNDHLFLTAYLITTTTIILTIITTAGDNPNATINTIVLFLNSTKILHGLIPNLKILVCYKRC